MGKIIVLASISMDIIARTPTLPQPGETLFGHELHYIPGGKGDNQAVAASRLRDGVVMIGRIGDDGFGHDVKAFLSKENLDLTYLKIDPEAPTGIAIIAVDDNSENAIIVISAANMRVAPEDVADVRIAAGDTVLAPFEVPQEATKALFQRAKAAGATTVINPAPAKPFIEGLQELVDVLIVNETELAIFSGMAVNEITPEALEGPMRQMRVRDDQIIVVTLGSAGVVYLDGDERVYVPGRKVAAVDTTGAGDCFTGSLATALSEGMPLEQAVHFANVAASLSVQKIGASASMPYRADVDAAL
ncbi:MAG: ribokinase [Anaerolineae bacterium]|nr:ribokinase [Anaerolineae bacterium]